MKKQEGHEKLGQEPSPPPENPPFWKQEKIPLILLSSVILLCLLGILYTQSLTGTLATVTVGGEVLFEVDLDKVSSPYTYEVLQEGGLYNLIAINQGSIAILEANCPDQICVLQGESTDSPRPIICLPHQVVIRLTLQQEEVDGVTG